MSTTIETVFPDKKCVECNGTGTITRLVPRYAIAMPKVSDDWAYEDQKCWRCKGDGVARGFTTISK